MGVVGQRHAPAALSPGKNRYPLCRRLVGPQGRSGQVRNISSPPAFDPRSVQPIVSGYTDCAFPTYVAQYSDFFLVKLLKIEVSSTAFN